MLCDVLLPCYVLEDGTRLLCQDALAREFDLTCVRVPDSGSEIHPSPSWGQENLGPFVGDELFEAGGVIEFVSDAEGPAYGYHAEILPGLCDVYLAARDAGALLPAQEMTARLAEQLVRRLAHLGIVARIDEALGYEEAGGRPTVEEVLALYLRPYQTRWTKRFPDEFYQELYRLRGWEWQGMEVNRFPITGHFTNDLVYARITDGLLDQLRLNNPKSGPGGREHRHHQWLTDEFGVQELREHLVGVIAIMRSIEDSDPKRAWQKFYRSLQRAYPRKDTNYNFDFDE